MAVLVLAGEDDTAYVRLARQFEGRDPAQGASGGSVRGAVIGAAAHALLTEAPEQVAHHCISFLRPFILEASPGPSRAPTALTPPQPPLPTPPTPTPPACSRSAEEQTVGPAVLLNTTPRVQPFCLTLNSPLPLARGEPLTAREGLVLVLTGTALDGRVVSGIGELCPLPGFHRETCAAHEGLTHASPGS